MIWRGRDMLRESLKLDMLLRDGDLKSYVYFEH